MANRPETYKEYANELEFVVAAGGAATEGQGAKFSTTDKTVTNAAAGEASFGVFMHSAAATERVRICTPFVAIVPVRVGTGGTATRGKPAVVGTAGYTDAPTLGGGTTARNVAGVFLQSGVANDFVSMGLTSSTSVSA